MDRIIAYCGLVCSECPAYLATQTNDDVALQRVVERWRVEYHAPNMAVEYAICDGCLGVAGRHCGHCAECDIRACGVERGVLNCAHCTDYDTCGRLRRFFGFVPHAKETKETLDEVRRVLPS